MRMFLSVHPYKSINSQLALQMEITDHVKLTFSFTLDRHIFPQFQMFTKCKSRGSFVLMDYQFFSLTITSFYFFALWLFGFVTVEVLHV